jgi:hypothetical protein
MSKKRIFTVGFSLPGDDFEYVDFDSDQTLLDADVILFTPTLGDIQFEYGQQYSGKPILSQHHSFATKKRLDHWHAEIITAVNAGKLVIVYLAKPAEYYRYSGTKDFSGTGRNRITTLHVVPVSSYEAVPNIKKVLPKTGAEIRLDKDGSYLAPYWTEFSKYSPYEVQIEGEFNRNLLKTRSGERIVGAAFHGKLGALLFLPPLSYDEGVFLRDAEVKKGEEDGEVYWTEVALQFSKRLFGALVNLANALKQSVQLTPAPNWSLASEYRLAHENELDAQINDCMREIGALQKRKAAFESELKLAGSLRRLLYEQGKPLESAVLEAMRLLGFDAQAFADGQSEFDGIFSSAEGRCLGEVEGKTNKAISIEKFSQLERNIMEDFERDEVTKHAKGLLFGNAYKAQPISDRGEFFTEKCISAAKRIGVALIRTPDLFGPAKYHKEHPSDLEYSKQCRAAIFSTSGDVVVFPEPPLVETTTLTETLESEEVVAPISDIVEAAR